jgi:hypothetical protein
VIAAVRAWVEETVVGLNLCPFAAHPLRAGRVDFVLGTAATPGDVLSDFLAALEFTGDTVLLIEPVLADWDDFLDVVDACQDLLDQTGLSAQYQLAHMHPDYVFEGLEPNDPANGTNRAPAPVIQVLRVDQVADAVAAHPDPLGIPDRNIALLRRLAQSDTPPAE